MSSLDDRRFPGTRTRRFAGLLRLELRSLAGIALVVAALVGASAGLALYAFPIVLDLGGTPFWNLVSVAALVCGLPLVAQSLEADWRTGVAGTLRIAPVSRWSVFAAKGLAVTFWTGIAWCVVAFACGGGLALSPEPDGGDAVLLGGVFEDRDFWRSRNAVAVMAYGGTAALSLAFRHALAATLGGLLTIALPWLCLAAFDDVSHPIALFGLTCVAASMFAASHPIGSFAALGALGAGFFLRGRAARAPVRRAAYVGALVLGLVAVRPAFLVAESALVEHRFDDPDGALDGAELNPITGELMVTTRHPSGFGHRATLWLVDPLSGEVQALPNLVQGLLSAVPGFPPYVGGGWTSDGERYIGVYSLNAAGDRNAFFSLHTERGTIESTDNADYADELCYGGWHLEWLTGPQGRHIRISRPGVAPFELDTRRLRALPSLRPDLFFYVDREYRVHRVDVTTREDRILDIVAPADRLPLDVSPDGQWLMIRAKSPRVATLVEVETERSRELPSASYGWTRRELPVLLRTPGAAAGSWTLIGLDAEQQIELDLGDTWAPVDIDGTHWLVRSNRSGLFTVDALGRVVRVLREER